MSKVWEMHYVLTVSRRTRRSAPFSLNSPLPASPRGTGNLNYPKASKISSKSTSRSVTQGLSITYQDAVADQTTVRRYRGAEAIVEQVLGLSNLPIRKTRLQVSLPDAMYELLRGTPSRFSHLTHHIKTPSLGVLAFRIPGLEGYIN